MTSDLIPFGQSRHSLLNNNMQMKHTLVLLLLGLKCYLHVSASLLQLQHSKLLLAGQYATASSRNAVYIYFYHRLNFRSLNLVLVVVVVALQIIFFVAQYQYHIIIYCTILLVHYCKQLTRIIFSYFLCKLKIVLLYVKICQNFGLQSVLSFS